jgi:C4-dicarboxylate transporter, DctM subunit
MGMENVPGMLQGAIERWKMTPGDTMFAFNILLLIVGMFLDAPAALILFAPILSTAATSAGIDPVHFGAVMILNLNIGLLTPPVGFCLFAAERIAGCGMPALVRAITPFLGANLIALGLLSAFPPIALWLPRVLGF